MSVTAIEGVVEDGVIRLPESIHLPENARVYVVIPDEGTALKKTHIFSPRLVDPEQAVDFTKDVVEE